MSFLLVVFVKISFKRGDGKWFSWWPESSSNTLDLFSFSISDAEKVLLLFCVRWSCLITLRLNFVREKRKWLALLHSCSSRWGYKKTYLFIKSQTVNDGPIPVDVVHMPPSFVVYWHTAVAIPEQWGFAVVHVFLTKRTNFISYLVITVNM